MLTNDVPPVGPSRKLSALFKLCCSIIARKISVEIVYPEMHEGSLDVKIANLNQNKKPLLDSWIILDNPLGPCQNHFKTICRD